MNQEKLFQSPMQPWPSLAPFGKKISLCSLNIEIFFFEAGQENFETIILIHGLGDEADTWRHVFIPLADKFHVIALDLPGFGRSEKVKRASSPGFLVESLLGLIQKLNVTKPILMGSSLGGILAHQIALENPTLLRALILVGGAINPKGMRSNLSMRLMQIPFLGEWLYTRLRKDPQAAFESLQTVYHDLMSLSIEDRNFLFTRVNNRVWDDRQKDAYLSLLRKLPNWMQDQQKQLAINSFPPDVPVLVVRGEFDPLFSEDNGVYLVNQNPKCSLIQIKNAGHLPHQECPVIFLENLKKWLAHEILENKIPGGS